MVGMSKTQQGGGGKAGVGVHYYRSLPLHGWAFSFDPCSFPPQAYPLSTDISIASLFSNRHLSWHFSPTRTASTPNCTHRFQMAAANEQKDTTDTKLSKSFISFPRLISTSTPSLISIPFPPSKLLVSVQLVGMYPTTYITTLSHYDVLPVRNISGTLATYRISMT